LTYKGFRIGGFETGSVKPTGRGGGMMENEKAFELTRCEVVLHEFNKKAIDDFLKANGVEVEGDDWGKKIKLVLSAIERTQLNEKNAKK
jgi:hypothetical protein